MKVSRTLCIPTETSGIAVLLYAFNDVSWRENACMILLVSNAVPII